MPIRSTGADLSTNALFRASALERMAAPDRLDMAAAIVRPAYWALVLSCCALVVAAVVAGILVHLPVKVAANGILLDVAGVKEVAATAAGQIRALSVRTGDRVRVGDVIATIEQPDLKQDIEAAAAELKDARDQLDRTLALQRRIAAEQEAFRAQQRDTLTRSAGFSTQKVAALTERLRDFEGLAVRGVITRQRLLDARNEANAAQEELAKTGSGLKQLDVEASAQAAERERERLSLDLKVASAERKVEMLRERLGRVDVVTSPYNGAVGELKVNGGELVERGAALVAIVPEGLSNPGDEPAAPLIATLYVDPADGKKARPGMDVEIMPSTVKREEYGFIRGKVVYVSDVPATQEGMLRTLKNRQLVQTLANGGAPFEVRATLEPDPATRSRLRWSTSAGPNLLVSSGSPCRAEIVTLSEPALQVLLPASRALFGWSGR
ncbi:NHLP bacteriocin system secretion protein [Methylobacterium nonmethylotrophicum]|uniref:NHLP bacteriocin system secretion protein n=1 Tax=Methylobacterium nonmethylotrophicum TaxID=1141884 RepID=A0A4Z0NU57_9HYPH|nr:NHLP bacteriocin system secretion protein [Methylobacterium nonmethylotrophicum]TGE01064.1 NHLP bacteriocin system secretion protein [Methylobacterium nonmethylotrophicum]